MMFLLFLTLPCSIMAASISNDEHSVECLEGQQKADLYNKQQYYKCNEGCWEPTICPDELVYDSIHGNCNAESISDDDHAVECLEGQQKADLYNKQQYYECNEGCWEPTVCPDGLVYDSIHGNCNAESVYDDDHSVECLEGQQKADLYYKQLYYECNEGCWEPMICPDGLVYDSIHGNCYEVPDYCLEEGQETPDMNNDEQYHECIREYWDSMDCPDGFVYDDIHGYCYLEDD